MKNILYISSINLKDPCRGTPLRIFNILKQVSKKNNLIAYVKDFNISEDISFFKLPQLNFFTKIFYFIKIIKNKKINIILTSTVANIKLLILLKILTRKKIVIDLHGISVEEWLYFKKISRFKKFFLDLKIKIFLLFYDEIFVVSKKLKEYYLGINKNIKVVYGGVNIDKFSIGRLMDDGEYFSIGYMGNFRSYQGIQYLIEAVKIIRSEGIINLKLNFVLSGNKNYIKNKIKEYGIESIVSLSCNVEHDKVINIISNSDVLVIPRPSLKMTEYAFPSKLSDYIATGIPVITTDVGPVRELFREENVCKIIESFDIAGNLKDAIIEMYNLGNQERKGIGERAIRFAEKNLSWDIIGDKINKYLKED
ncbi:MAG: glycosyltransferase family 4 protein [Candidatus Helarchaeota archaeon]